MHLSVRALIFVWSGQSRWLIALKLHRIISLSSLQPISWPLLKQALLTTQSSHIWENINWHATAVLYSRMPGSKERLDMKTQLLYSSVNLMAFHWTDKRPLNHSSVREMLYAHSFPVAHRSEISGVHRDRVRGRLEGSGIAKLCIMHVCGCSGAWKPI